MKQASKKKNPDSKGAQRYMGNSFCRLFELEMRPNGFLISRIGGHHDEDEELSACWAARLLASATNSKIGTNCFRNDAAQAVAVAFQFIVPDWIAVGRTQTEDFPTRRGVKPVPIQRQCEQSRFRQGVSTRAVNRPRYSGR